MKFKIALLLIAQVAIGSFLYAQTKVKTFIKGDIVPANMVIGKMVNHKMNTAKFSNFRGKLVILDFWATHCSPCVAGLPRMDSLQRKYGNKIAIIPITSEDSRTIQNYFNKKKFKLPSVVKDKILYKTFPQTALDLHVWVDQKGKIIATTSGEDVNFKTVDEYFKTGKVNAKERIDIVGGFDSSKPLFVNGNGGSGNAFLGRSILTNTYLRGEQTGGLQLEFYPDINQMHMIKGVKMWNGSPVNIFFKILFGLEASMNFSFLYKELENGKVIPFSESNESSRLWNAFDKYINVKGDGVINYELIIPSPGASTDNFFKKYLLTDLNKYFDFIVKIEKRKIPSWIFINANNGINPLAKKNDDNLSKIVYDDDIELNHYEKIQNMSLNGFLGIIRNWWTMVPPVFNETGYQDEKVNLNNLHIKYKKDGAQYKSTNLDEWRAAFQRNGLDIKVEDREVEVMVFKKKETPTK